MKIEKNMEINSQKSAKIYKALYSLMAISMLIRCFLVYFIELGNDEVYYINYALYPNWSYFDHPPFVGWLIRISTFNMLFNTEFFIRLGPVIIGTLNTYIIFLIGQKLKSELVGFYAAMLYTCSIYCFIIVGCFIMPDSPQGLFWLLSLLFFIKAFEKDYPQQKEKFFILIAAFFVGLGMLSKYTAAFLWVGAGLYILFFSRKWLKEPVLYLSVIVTLLCFLPVIIWNFQNDFISLNFHSERVTIEDSGFNFTTLATEILGSIFYNNVINVGIIIVAIYSYFFQRQYVNKNHFWLLIFFAMPIILLFIGFSMFRQTLPHWSAPGYYSLIVIAALFLEDINKIKTKLFPLWIKLSFVLMILILSVALFQIKTGFFELGRKKDYNMLGADDFSLDMYSWHQFADKFSQLREKHIKNNIMPYEPVIVGYKWFPSANIDYYVARPNGIKLITLSPIYDAHEYYRISQIRKGLEIGADAYYVNSSRYYMEPDKAFYGKFEKIYPMDTIKIFRNNNHVMNYVIWYMENYKGN